MLHATESAPLSASKTPVNTLSPVAARNQALLNYRDGGLHLAYRFTGNTADAEDILQEAYLHALRTTRPLLEGTALRNWFLQIVANAARDFVRSSASRRTRERNIAMEFPRITLPPSAEPSELKQRVESELATLDEKFRVPIALHYEQGLTFEEASAILRIPAATLRVQASRGLQELRERLGPAGDPVPAAVLVAALAAGLSITATPACAASVAALVKSGATAPVPAGAKVFLANNAPSFKHALLAAKIAGAVMLLALISGMSYWLGTKTGTTDSVQMTTAVSPPTAPPANTDISQIAPLAPGALPLPGGPAPAAAMTAAARDRAAAASSYTMPAALEQTWDNAVDLIGIVDPARDEVVGNWERRGKELFVNKVAYSKLQLPYYPTPEYDYRVDFTRTGGKAEVDVTFPVDGKLGLLSVGAWGQIYFSGHPDFEKNPDAVRGIYLQNMRRYTVIVEVRQGTLAAYLDGKQVLRIDRNKSMWQSNPHWRLPDQEAFGLGSWDSDVLFHRVLVREIGGQGHVREDDPDLARIATNAHWTGAVDLLANVNLKKRFSEGHWSVVNNALKVEKAEDAQWARTELGYTPPDEYDFRIDFRRTESNKDIVQICAAHGTAFSWKLSASDISMFDTINGNIWINSPAAVTMPHFCADFNPHSSVVCVRNDCLKAFVDGKLMGKWKTDYSDMGIDIWKLRHPVLGVGANLSGVIFDKILVKDITGKGVLDAPAGGAKDDGGF